MPQTKRLTSCGYSGYYCTVYYCHQQQQRESLNRSCPHTVFLTGSFSPVSLCSKIEMIYVYRDAYVICSMSVWAWKGKSTFFSPLRNMLTSRSPLPARMPYSYVEIHNSTRGEASAGASAVMINHFKCEYDICIMIATPLMHMLTGYVNSSTSSPEHGISKRAEKYYS